MDRAEPGPQSKRLRLGSERGEIATIVFSFAIAMMVFIGCVHTALVFHGRSVVSAAAQDGLRAVQAEDGTEGEGVAAAEEVLALAPVLVDDSIVIEIIAGDDVNSVRVTAKIKSPFGESFTTVSANVEGPTERFYSEAERE